MGSWAYRSSDGPASLDWLNPCRIAVRRALSPQQGEVNRSGAAIVSVERQTLGPPELFKASAQDHGSGSNVAFLGQDVAPERGRAVRREIDLGAPEIAGWGDHAP